MPSSEASNLLPKSGGKDPCWKYGVMVEPNNANKISCNYYKQVFFGGITHWDYSFETSGGNQRKLHTM